MLRLLLAVIVGFCLLSLANALHLLSIAYGAGVATGLLIALVLWFKRKRA